MFARRAYRLVILFSFFFHARYTQGHPRRNIKKKQFSALIRNHGRGLFVIVFLPSIRRVKSAAVKRGGVVERTGRAVFNTCSSPSPPPHRCTCFQFSFRLHRGLTVFSVFLLFLQILAGRNLYDPNPPRIFSTTAGTLFRLLLFLRECQLNTLYSTSIIHFFSVQRIRFKFFCPRPLFCRWKTSDVHNKFACPPSPLRSNVLASVYYYYYSVLYLVTFRCRVVVVHSASRLFYSRFCRPLCKPFFLQPCFCRPTTRPIFGARRRTTHVSPKERRVAATNVRIHARARFGWQRHTFGG